MAFKAGASGVLLQGDLPTIGNSVEALAARSGSLPPQLLFQDPLAKVSLEAALSNLKPATFRLLPVGSSLSSDSDEVLASLGQFGLNLSVSRAAATIDPFENSRNAFPGRDGSLTTGILLQDPLAKVSLEAAFATLNAVSVKFQPSGSPAGFEATASQSGLMEPGSHLFASQPAKLSHFGEASGVSASASVEAVVLDPASAPGFSIDSGNSNFKGVNPLVVIPEPSSFSLLVVGLGIMGLAYRFGFFSPRFTYFLSEEDGDLNTMIAPLDDAPVQYILSGAAKAGNRGRFDFFAVAI
jgi:hypothetical protein